MISVCMTRIPTGLRVALQKSSGIFRGSLHVSQFSRVVKRIKSLNLGVWSGLALLKCHPLHRIILPVSCDTFQSSSDAVSPVKSSRDPYTWSRGDLFVLIWPEFFSLACAVLGALSAAAMNILIPIYLGEFVEAIALWSNRDGISSGALPTLKLFVAYVVQSVATFSYISVLASVGERIAFKLRNDLLKTIIHNEVAYFDTHNSGKLIDSLTADVQTFKSAFKQCISIGLRSTTQILGSFFSLLSISPMLTGTLLSSLPCMFLIGSLMGTELRRLSQKAQSQHSTASSIAEESFTHIRSVKALSMEELQLERYRDETEKARALNEQLGYGIGMFQGLSNLTLNGVVLGVLYVGGHLIYRDELRSGQLMAFLVTTQTIQRSMAQLSLLFSQLLRGSTALNRIFGVLHDSSRTELLPQRTHSSISNKLYEQWSQPGHAPDLHFDAVRFAYPTRPEAVVLDELNLSIPAGNVVALVGQSGAGKSTVVSLIERFYNPSSGRITLGSHDLRDFSLSSLRGQLVGYIIQEPQIFNTSIRENIRLGKPDATDQQVEEAARLANAHDFIVNQLPKGYETRVGQGSDSVAGLSGGQRQRIAIARVILKNSPFLILDEATSALDAESEAQVQGALKTVMKGRTVLVIAHRLSTVRGADWIIVMSQGKVAEEGTHQALMAKRGVYYNLVQRQEGADILS
ncbi:hypothetical protein CRM22_001301 [Opisthorchis felineus]|uniref:Mitochondrial potassium channel ATP-binding subunit n=1 Tax=Opisthorchis felineus TaxID=147828 RepID=A0A4S2MB32_OPIFE|nr:hypothetical protein CRM22_001301 [Opisthorchis felineus]